MTEPDLLRRALHGAADSIAAGDTDAALVGVGATARRRTRRTRVAGGLAALGVVVAGAVVLSTVDDEPGTLVSTPPTEVEPTPAPSTVESSAPTVPSTTAEPSVTRPVGPAELVDRPLIAGAANGEDGAPDFGGWVAPWRDGFLVGSGVSQAVALPTDWPEDIVALFPSNVVELFQPDAPATVDEAVEALAAAGLLEEVSAIVRDNPEARAFIYGEPVDEPPVADARFTVDGTAWEPVEMTLPTGVAEIEAVASVGGDLVIVYRDARPDADGAVSVARSSDLANWTIQRVERPAPAELPPGLVRMALVRDLAANDSGWVLQMLDVVRIDVTTLLEAAGLPFPDGAVNSRNDADGVQILDPAGGVEVAYTWDELGVPADAVAYALAGGDGPEAWASTWDGAPARSDAAAWSGPMVATPAGFVRWDRQTRFSPDGISWTAAALPNPEGYVVTAFAFDGGIIAVGNTFDGVPEVYRLDETGGAAELLEITGMPTVRQAGYNENWAPGSAIVFDGGVQGFSMLSVEQDGYRLSVRPAVGVFELVDLATGEIVAREIAARVGADAEPIFDFDSDGVTVTDPDTGEVLVSISQERLDESDAIYFEESGSGADDEQLSLLATLDGELFVLEPRVGGGFESGNVGVATNGARVLVATGTGWASFQLP
jgi:hypothetical protein